MNLTSGVPPSRPPPPTLASFTDASMTIQWELPTDTGFNSSDPSLLKEWSLEVDDGFTSDFVALYSTQAATLSYTHVSVILGRTYRYRVRARNQFSWSEYSSPSNFSNKRVPGRPLSAPNNDASNRTSLNIRYDSVADHGGSPITSYNIYIGDGSGGPFSSPINNYLNLTFSSESLSLSPGKYYRLKYSANNSLGESPHSA